ncbi:hypothetical protein E2320_002019 [Naja naja]|nr:hypothetical protein E2320_002019 [Naja naja]
MFGCSQSQVWSSSNGLELVKKDFFTPAMRFPVWTAWSEKYAICCCCRDSLNERWKKISQCLAAARARLGRTADGLQGKQSTPQTPNARTSELEERFAIMLSSEELQCFINVIPPSSILRQ